MDGRERERKRGGEVGREKERARRRERGEGRKRKNDGHAGG